MSLTLLFRCLLGGAIVSLFALAGDLFRPKTFAGLFGSAPSVALATLALAFVGKGAGYVVLQAQGMIVGALGLVAYAIACVSLARTKLPVWLGAALSWVVWCAVALGAFYGLRGIGASL